MEWEGGREGYREIRYLKYIRESSCFLVHMRTSAAQH